MMEVRCQELGIAGCSYAAREETAGEVLEDMVVHLRQEHDLEMPPAKKLLKVYREPGQAGSIQWGQALDANLAMMDEGARLVARRLMERLGRSN